DVRAGAPEAVRDARVGDLFDGDDAAADRDGDLDVHTARSNQRGDPPSTHAVRMAVLVGSSRMSGGMRRSRIPARTIEDAIEKSAYGESSWATPPAWQRAHRAATIGATSDANVGTRPNGDAYVNESVRRERVPRESSSVTVIACRPNASSVRSRARAP